MRTFNEAIPSPRYTHFSLGYIFFLPVLLIRKGSKGAWAAKFRAVLFGSENIYIT